MPDRIRCGHAFALGEAVERLAGCDGDQMGVEKASELTKGLQEVLRPLLEQVEALTAAIKECDRKMKQIAKDKYPETTLLRQVSGVGIDHKHGGMVNLSRIRHGHGSALLVSSDVRTDG